MKQKELFDASKYKDPLEALNKASIKDYIEMHSRMLWVNLQMRQPQGAIEEFISQGFEGFYPIAQNIYHGDGLRREHIREIWDNIMVMVGGARVRI